MQLLFWLLLLCVSCCCFIDLIVYPFKRKKYSRKRAEKAMATVIAYKIDTEVAGIKYYFPITAFKDKTGKRIVVNAETGRSYKPEEGRQSEIYCLPDEPCQFYIIDSSPGEIYILPVGLVVITAIVYAIFKTIAIL